MQDDNGFITMDAETGANLSRDHNNMLSEVTIDSTIRIINSRDANGILRRRVIDSSGVMTTIDRVGDSEFRNGAISTNRNYYPPVAILGPFSDNYINSGNSSAGYNYMFHMVGNKSVDMTHYQINGYSLTKLLKANQNPTSQLILYEKVKK